MSEQTIPVFATNRDNPRETVADAINQMYRVKRHEFQNVPSAAIATAYINAAGFMLLADELEHLPRIRVLLGAEPTPEIIPHDLDSGVRDRKKIKAALDTHEQWLKAERDAIGFEPRTTAAAKKLVEWIERADAAGDPIVEIRRYSGGFLHGKAYLAEHPSHPAFLAGSSNLTFAGLTRNAELNVGENHNAGAYPEVLNWFEEHWLDSEPYDLAELYRPIWEEHSPWTVFLRMLLERYGQHLEDEAPAPTRFELTRFQADGVRRMKRLLSELGGVLVADEVGLGKTFLALEVIAAATEELRQRVMVVAPAALKAGVWEPAIERYDLSRKVTVHSYEEVRNQMNPEHKHHTVLKQQAEDAALIIVDEAHNLRNAGAARSAALDQIILAGTNPKKVVLLTATPVNNSLRDLETLIKYFVRDDAKFANIGIPSISEYIKQAQHTDPEALTPGHLFDLMDQVAVRRTRSFVKKNYLGESITGPGGKKIAVEFPDAVARRIDYELDDAGDELVEAMIYALGIPEEETHAASFDVRRNDPDRLLLARYTPSAYRLDNSLDATQVNNMGLLRSALLKRLESSPLALSSTLDVLIRAHEGFLSGLEDGYVLIGGALRDYVSSESEDLEAILAGLDEDTEHQAVPVDEFHAELLRSDVALDLVLIRRIKALAEAANHAAEPKAAKLIDALGQIAEAAKPVSPRGISSGDRRKVIVFSTYADTIRDLHGRVSAALEAADESSPLWPYKGRLAPSIFGEAQGGGAGGVHQDTRARAIAQFAPRTAGKLNDAGDPVDLDKYDILLTTDVLSEGVNLQQSAQIINYDLPWNPMRIVQRHGRVDRIGSEHPEIHLGLFFPASNLDEYLKLESTLVRKLRQADAAVGIGTVLPGVEAFPPQDHYDADEIAREIEELVNADGGSAAGSGEEYRRRLANALDADAGLKARLENLPHNIGSGFVNPRLDQNTFVFCMRMGESEQVWFRNVRADAAWAPIAGEDGTWLVEDDTLKSLSAADPGDAKTPRVLDDATYQAAYPAWEIARAHAHAEWMRSTDPKNLTPDLPKSFIDARAFVVDTPSNLSTDKIQETVRRLKSVPSAKARKAMRGALTREGLTDAERVNAIVAVLDEFGIQPATKVEPLPVIAAEEIRLVAWMAVQPGEK